jgi:two-component system sensor histidine kinase AlgZ
MAGPTSTRRGATLYLMVWLMLGLMLAGLIASTTGAAWSNSLLFAIPLTLVYAFAAGYSAYYLCRAYPLAERHPASITGVLLVAATLSGTMWTALAVAFNSMSQSVAPELAGIELSRPLLVILAGLGILLYGLCAAGHYLVTEFERARTSERRELESQLMAQTAELRMLRTQIDPHFLFNSLNSISALTTINPQAARDMTVQLAQFFRHSLGLEAHTKVTVDAEMTLIEHFLAIEKVRFNTRLNIEQTIDDAARSCMVPPMILQPLVENAVKHGIANLTEGGTVRIAVQRLGSLLQLSVENDVDADQIEGGRKGIGLANVRQRLSTAYGHEASVNWQRTETSFRVVISMPAELQES